MSNIKSKIIKDIKEIDINDTCNYTDGYMLMSFPIKLESFYDCEDVNLEGTEIDKFCHNKITSEALCCEKRCCFKGITNEKEHNYCLNKLDIPKINIVSDIRNNKCSNYGKYNGRFYNINNKKVCVKKDTQNYEDLLKRYGTSNNFGFSCNNKIYYDSMHYFCDYNNEYIKDGSKAVIKNIFSVAWPNYLEIEQPIKLSIQLNKKKLDEDEIAKENKRIEKITSKSIYKAFMDDKCEPQSCTDKNNYNIKKSFVISDIVQNSNEIVFENFKNNAFIQDKQINWFTRNYIKFNNYTELNKFKKYFDENDYKNNSLYEISKNLYPYYESFIIGIIVCIASIIFLVFSIINYSKKNEIDFVINLESKENEVNKVNKVNMNFIKFALIFILFIVYLILYLALYHKYEDINIDMEKFYSKVLEKYNSRRKQIYFLIGLILFAFNLFMELLILNLKCDLLLSRDNAMNGPPINSVTVYIKLTENNCQHQCKLYLKSKFSDNIKKIKNVLSRCRNCHEEEDVTSYFFNNDEININETVKNIGIRNGEVITLD